MPAADAILARLSLAATDLLPVAVAWHALALMAVIALLFGWRPPRRTAALLLVAPLASVWIVALAYGVVANAIVFALVTARLIAVAARLPTVRVERRVGAATAGGAALVALAWIYPHFLGDLPVLAYVVGAPMGLLPCPTLMAVIGVTLLGGGLGSRAWSLTLVALGVVYGVVGIAWLGVLLDAALLAGAAALAGVISISARPTPALAAGQ